MSGLSFHHAVAQTLWHGKLFHIDLNAQRIGKYDQDFRFGSEGVRDAFYLVKLLEDSHWDGMRHFDAHAYRTEDADGVWDFARGCMRTYLILREKVQRFHDDVEIQAALEVAKVGELREPTFKDKVTPDAIAALRRDAFAVDLEALAEQGYGHERLDQLVTELLLGVR
jgi:xylose isomerase